MSSAEQLNIKEAERSSSSNSERVFADRKRTNILRGAEQALIMFLVEKLPLFITSNVLTFLGAAGSALVFLSFILARSHPVYLLLGIVGLALNWFGDSLDGRLAYYRNTPRKWYGFALDIVMDWFSTVCIGFGFYIYAEQDYEWLGFLFVALYGWAILLSQLRYKITNKYAIDSGVVGPTELRLIIALILIAEAQRPSLINYAGAVISFVLFILNVKDTFGLLKEGDIRDRQERELLH